MPDPRTLGAVALVVSITAAAYPAASLVIKRLGFDQKAGTRSSNPSVALLVAAAFNLVIAGAALAVYVLVGHRRLSAMGFHLTGNDTGVGLAIVAFTGVLAWLFVGSRVEARSPSAPLLGPVVIGLTAAAFQEEVVFRGFIVSLLRPDGWVVAILVSTLLFTLVHFLTTQVTWHRTLKWLLGGVSLFTVYYISGSVWAATVAHLARNLANALLLLEIPGASLVRLRTRVSEGYHTVYTLVWSIGTILLAITWHSLGHA